MKKTLFKKNFIFAAAFFFAKAFSLAPPENFSQYVLSNGMTVFVYEDFSAPTVQIEYSAKAGFSCQSAKTAGFAPLCASLFSKAGLYTGGQNGEWLLDGLESECGADSARHSILASPAECQEIFRELSVCAFAPIFSDQELEKKLKAAKEEAAKNAFSAEGFINGAIDSRVFFKSPWKHDSGIYPALFQKQSLSEARGILTEMAKNYYSPQNSALFVTGAIKKEDALFLAEKTFGLYPPAQSLPDKEESGRPGKDYDGGQKKFILSDPELSPDMEQAVFEWTSLSMEEADIAAVILNQSLSALKKSLTEEEALNIRGSDYINAAASHKSNSSRLIIQSLLEKSKASHLEQALLFERLAKEKIADFTEEEFKAAKNFLCADFELNAGSPRTFMNLLSQFWAVDGIAKTDYEQSGQRGDAKSLVQRFLARPQKIMAEEYEELKMAFSVEEPFEFFLLNAKSYSPLASSFKKQGFENVTQKNASWHAQKMFAAIKESIENPEKKDEGFENLSVHDQNFVQSVKENSKSRALSNSIPVHALIQRQSSASSVSLYIKGGEAESAQSQMGLEAVLESVLAANARKACAQKIQSGQMKGFPRLSWQTGDTSGLVTIECLLGDEAAALECLGEALIFSDIIPSDIDRAISSRKSAQIIKTSAMPRQLYGAAVRAFYKQGICRALYSDKQEILKGLSFNQVLEAYAKLLDAGRLEIIGAGNFSAEDFFEKAQEVFGSLSFEWLEKEIYEQGKAPAKSAQRVKINHTFLTDISADKAGPRPAVLIPTTDFADPVQYCFLAPTKKKDAALFDALLTRLLFLCQKEFSAESRYQKMSARLEEKSPLLSFGAMTFFNVKYISDADAVLEKALLKLKEEISGGNEDSAPKSAFTALDAIKSLWLKSAFLDSDTNTGAAKVLAKKIDQARAAGLKSLEAGEALSEDYEAVTKAKSEDFLALFQKHFEKFYKFYSADSKK